MSQPGNEWFVEQFHLQSPIEEFQTHCRLEIERLRKDKSDFDEGSYREAIHLVMERLRPAGIGQQL